MNSKSRNIVESIMCCCRMLFSRAYNMARRFDIQGFAPVENA